MGPLSRSLAPAVAVLSGGLALADVGPPLDDVCATALKAGDRVSVARPSDAPVTPRVEEVLPFGLTTLLLLDPPPREAGAEVRDAAGRRAGSTRTAVVQGRAQAFVVSCRSGRDRPPADSSPSARSDAAAWFVAGVTAARGTRWGEAAAAFRQATQLEPQAAEGFHRLGLALSALGEGPAAVAAFQAAVQIRPDLHEAWTHLGYEHGRAGRHGQAIAALREAVRLKPDDQGAWYNLGVELVLGNLLEEAVVVLREATRLDARDLAAWTNLATVYETLKRDDDALAAYGEVLRLNPDSAKAWFFVGMREARDGKTAAAEEIYTRLQRLDPRLARRFSQRALGGKRQ